ncbi:ABC transporter ATP-binding protein/permease [Candidatus Saccharibacteria bacterium]|nr:ABC transporter ATP-binding protein/permease [Candidatus Saccharibacteria bacterium]
MLEIRGVTKVYDTGDLKQTALDHVSINFRANEFASVLGPSGSGKTTLLNIIGGLDHYTSGDLKINEISTKKFKDKDWDSYRNHRIGFVFQSYNLIPHQTVLQNVRLALTLSGISKKEGIKRAKEALKQVGLEKHINKRPSQLSGGQMQRVAIARAIVNNPEILLADEPTGALDSDTSVQIMDLLKKIAKTRLVIMVTHNPELAEKYSTRIVKLKDGKIIADSNPYDGKVNTKESNETKKKVREKRTKMSFFTALSLSFKNLLTKKGRTILVAFAGSIGIIGIALILAVSTGFHNYVDHIQETTLLSYPLSINEKSADLAQLLLGTAGKDTKHQEGKITESNLLGSTMNSVGINDLRSFKKYVETHNNEVKDDLAQIEYEYSIDPLIYTIDVTGTLAQINPSDLFTSIYGSSSMFSSYSSMMSVFAQISKDNMKRYEIIAGTYPEKYNEVLLVLPKKNEIPDFATYSLGLREVGKLKELMTAFMTGENVKLNNDPLVLDPEDLLNLDFRLFNAPDLYKYNEKYAVYEDMSSNDAYMRELYNKAEKIKVVGVAYMSEDNLLGISTGGVAYMPELIEHISKKAAESEIVKKQLNDKNTDVFSGKKFNEKTNPFDFKFEDLVSVDTDMLQQAFNINIDQASMTQKITEKSMDIINSVTADLEPAKKDFRESFTSAIKGLFAALEDQTISKNDVDTTIANYINSDFITQLAAKLEQTYFIPADMFKASYTQTLKPLLENYINYYATVDPTLTTDETNPTAKISPIIMNPDLIVEQFFQNPSTVVAEEMTAKNMVEAKVKTLIAQKLAGITTELTGTLANAFSVDQSKIIGAFKLNFTEDELKRVVTAMFTNTETTASSNLISLGYQDLEAPTRISFYFKTFDSKEHFMNFIDDYNDKMSAAGMEDRVIEYSDTTGLLMSSVKTIVDAVSYVLIAFVSISLVVSSIMIGIITYISVYERKKEIGILRAIGASKRNISNIFNAETFIIGFLSGIFGIATTYILIPIINAILHHFTGDIPLSASLAIESAFILIVISVILTILGGLIPARSASKKDPVEALRSE